MAEITPAGAPYPKSVLGWDGTAFRVFSVDSSGHVQIDVLSTVMDASAAADATVQEVSDRLGAIGTPALNTANDLLQKIRDRLGALSNPDGGSTNKLLTDALTALQLIDDLNKALHSVNTDELVVRGEDQLFSFKESLDVIVDDADADSTTVTLQSGQVPANTVWVVTAIGAVDFGHAWTRVDFGKRVGAVDYWLGSKLTIAEDELAPWNGHMYLDTDDRIRVSFIGVTVDDYLRFSANGYVMTKEV